MDSSSSQGSLPRQSILSEDGTPSPVSSPEFNTRRTLPTSETTDELPLEEPTSDTDSDAEPQVGSSPVIVDTQSLANSEYQDAADTATIDSVESINPRVLESINAVVAEANSEAALAKQRESDLIYQQLKEEQERLRQNPMPVIETAYTRMVKEHLARGIDLEKRRSELPVIPRPYREVDLALEATPRPPKEESIRVDSDLEEPFGTSEEESPPTPPPRRRRRRRLRRIIRIVDPDTTPAAQIAAKWKEQHALDQETETPEEGKEIEEREQDGEENQEEIETGEPVERKTRIVTRIRKVKQIVKRERLEGEEGEGDEVEEEVEVEIEEEVEVEVGEEDEEGVEYEYEYEYRELEEGEESDSSWEPYSSGRSTDASSVIRDPDASRTPTPEPTYILERLVAISAVRRACLVTERVFETMIEAFSENEFLTKTDSSPVTVGDFAAQALIATMLTNIFPDDPIVGEEDAKELYNPDNKAMLHYITELTNQGLTAPLLPYESEDWQLGESFEKSPREIRIAIDRGNHEGGRIGRMWTIDPIDGTKGFLRGEQYAVCLSLIVDGIPQVGVIGCPNLPIFPKRPEMGKGLIFSAVRGEGAERLSIDGLDPHIIAMPTVHIQDTVVLESVEAAHSSHGMNKRVSEILALEAEPLRMDSQAKYCALAMGRGNLYLRLPVNPNYKEKIWDHAPGSLLVEEAGGIISDARGEKLDFGNGRTLGTNIGIVATSVYAYGDVLDAVRLAMKEVKRAQRLEEAKARAAAGAAFQLAPAPPGRDKLKSKDTEEKEKEAEEKEKGEKEKKEKEDREREERETEEREKEERYEEGYEEDGDGDESDQDSDSFL